MVIYSEKIAKEYPIFVYSLKPLNKSNILERIGNKARNLVKLFQLGYNIPPSIFADYTFFKTYRRDPKIVKYLVDKILRDLSGDKIAIRSSSNIEDSRSGSFAGLFKTVLNVDNNSEILSKAIDEWFKSYLSPQFLELVNGKGIALNKIYIGLIIQRMITPKISGVLFTCPPINPTSNHFQLEYCFGAGDKLMLGSITGNLLNLDKSDGKTVRQRGEILLSYDNIQFLFHIAKTLETKLVIPQSIEFVISDKDDTFLLQSRPVTAFSFSPEFVIQKENSKIEKIFEDSNQAYEEYPILSNTNIVELFPNAIPLGYSIFKNIFAGTNELEGGINLGRGRLGYAVMDLNERQDLYVSVGNQARVNLFIDALTFRLRGIDKKLYIDTAVKRYMRIIRENTRMASYPEFSLYLQSDNERNWLELFGDNGHEMYKVHSLFLKQLKSTKIPEVLANISHVLHENESFYRKELSVSPENLNIAALKQKISEYLEYLRAKFASEYVIVARIAFLSAYLVKSKLTDFFKPDKNNNTSDIIEKYFNLLLFANKSCPDHFKMPSQLEFEEKVKTNSISLKEFLDIFQHLGPLDISQPRLGEYSETFLKNLIMKRKNDKSRKRSDSPHQPDLLDDFYRNYQKRHLDTLQEFTQLVDSTSIFMNLRENLKFELLKIMYLIKRITYELASVLNLNDTIYYLEVDDLLSDDYTLEDLSRKAMLQKAYFAACSHLAVNEVIINSKEQNIPKQPINDLRVKGHYKSVSGTTIHYGKAAGIALIARNNQEFYEKFMEYREKGANKVIGFFRGIELSYINLNGLSGIVTESGGYLAHAATIAREYDIPYISNVNIDNFKDGYYAILDTPNQQVIYKEHP